MNKINWKSKLTSRKFWMAIVGFLAPLLAAFGISNNEITQVSAIVMSGAAVVAYILGEGFIDANNTGSNNDVTDSAK